MSCHLAECLFKMWDTWLCRSLSSINLIVNGRLPDRSNHSVTNSSGTFSGPITREDQRCGVVQANCRHFRHTDPRHNGVLLFSSPWLTLGEAYWTKIWEAISGGNLWMRWSWFSFMTVRRARRLLCNFSSIVSNSWTSFSSLMSSVYAAQGPPSKTTHRSGRRTFALDRSWIVIPWSCWGWSLSLNAWIGYVF